MNLRYIKCLLSFHNWDWGKEIIWVKGTKVYNTYSAELTPVRVCQNCNKKQRYMNSQGWVDWNRLSKEELRDMKLEKLFS